jgi:hypothetical protein
VGSGKLSIILKIVKMGGAYTHGVKNAGKMLDA